MKLSRTAGVTLVLLAAAWLVPPALNRARRLCPLRPTVVPEARALPQWARRYGFECGTCHTTVPRLNRMGYDFRRAGFRMPDELGQEAKFSGLKDIMSAKFAAQYQYTGSATNGTATNAKVAAAHSYVLPQFSIYPISGAFGKYWSTRSELSFHPGANTEVENAYARATTLYKDFILYARAGVMHPFEGYGASDQSLGNIDPLFWTQSAVNGVPAASPLAPGSFNTLVMMMGQNQLGGEVGVGHEGTTASLAMWNGLNTAANASNQNGAITPGANNNHYDFRLFLNQMLGEKAAASLYYLNGKTDWGASGQTPANASVAVSNTGVVSGNAAVPVTWVNNYQRLAGYASYAALGEKLNLLAGYELGRDHRPDVNIGGNNYGDSFNSSGWFLAAHSKVCERFVAGFRGETFRPSYRTGSNRMTAFTLTGVVPVNNFKFTADYQVKRTQSGVGKDRTDNTLLAEWMLAF